MSPSPPRRARAMLAALTATAALAALPSSAGAAAAASPAADQTARAAAFPTTYVSQDRRLFITVATVRGTPTVGILWLGLPTFCSDGSTSRTTLITTAPLSGSGFESTVVNARGDIRFVQGQISGKTVTGVAKVSFAATAEHGLCSTAAQPFTASTR